MNKHAWILLAIIAAMSVGLPGLAQADDKVAGLHDDIATAVAFSPDGKLLASVGTDGALFIFQTDNLEEPIHAINLDGELSCLSFSPDGKRIVAAGNLERYEAAVVSVESGGVEKINLKSNGTIVFIVLDGKNHLTAISAGNRIIRYSIDEKKSLVSADIFGGFLGCASSSDQGAFVATSSKNEIDRRSAEPSKITIFDKDCKEVLSSQFEKDGIHSFSEHAFDSDHNLYMLNNKQVAKYNFDSKKTQWNPEIVKGKGFGEPTSIVVKGKPARIWIAVDTTVLEIDSIKFEVVAVHEFQIGPKIGKYWTSQINDLAVNLEAGLLAIACWDGIVRVSKIDTQQEQ